MATYSAIGPAAMPRPAKTPFFAGLSDESIAEFLADYGELADGHKLTNKQKVETLRPALAQRPLAVPTRLRIRQLDGLQRGAGEALPRLRRRNALLKKGLIDLVNLTARTRMLDEKDVLDYYRRFLAISNPLRAAPTSIPISRSCSQLN